MEYSIAHRKMNKLGERQFPDSQVTWREPTPPDLASGDSRRTTGNIRMCDYCGSMHPTDVVAAIKAGAHGSWADFKYGWPHKAYFDGIPNPHVGLLESRSAASYKVRENWVQVSDNHWRDPGTPAAATIMWKFYTVHLLDATPEEKAVIEAHLGLHFEFTPDGQVSWSKYEAQDSQEAT